MTHKSLIPHRPIHVCNSIQSISKIFTTDNQMITTWNVKLFLRNNKYFQENKIFNNIYALHIVNIWPFSRFALDLAFLINNCNKTVLENNVSIFQNQFHFFFQKKKIRKFCKFRNITKVCFFQFYEIYFLREFKKDVGLLLPF